MKTLILYTSKTGNTKTYAEDIAKQVNADVAPLKGSV
jgi:flavodoxin